MKTFIHNKFLEDQSKDIETAKYGNEGQGWNTQTEQEHAAILANTLGIKTKEGRRKSLFNKQQKIQRAKREVQKAKLDYRKTEFNINLDHQAEKHISLAQYGDYGKGAAPDIAHDSALRFVAQGNTLHTKESDGFSSSSDFDPATNQKPKEAKTVAPGNFLVGGMHAQ